ncbi:MAG TPA: ABC transporter ATP-binding protein [Streptosporangiaceae bacterium]|nr:ABC transporter ATP-binding protein [Streptosporangiaceae bacterium]
MMNDRFGTLRRPEPVLRVTNLRTEIRRRGATVRAVDGVSLEVGAGECVGLVGESGCGKTMTVRSIMRLLPRGGVITGGSVVLAGADLTQLSERDMQTVRGRDIGMVFQDPASCLDPTMTIGRQISESAVVHAGAGRGAAAARAIELLGMVAMPDPERAAGLYPHQLSGGMRQRAMIAAALACGPRLLIADEPTTALDVTIQRDILELIDGLRTQLGMAVILVTHDLGVIAGRTERVAVMYGGRIIEQAATSAVFTDPQHPYTEALLDALPELVGPQARALYSIPGRPPALTERPAGCSFASRCRYARDWCTGHEPILDGEHPGHVYACFFPVGALTGGPATGTRRVSAWTTAEGAAAGRPDRPPLARARSGSAPLLRVSGLVKDFPVTSGLVSRRAGTVSAVAGVSFELTAGETVGLVGESGCGKTTVARLLVGLERADAGAIEFRGTDLTRLTRRQLRSHRPGIELMFQDAFASLDPRMRVRSILSEPLAIQKTVRRRGHRRHVARILEEVGLPPEAAGRFPRDFSGGQRQRLALARALIQRPALIVADEPVSALDVSVQAQILNLMRKLQRQYELSYLFISHDLSVVRYMADTIGVMYLGKLVEVGPAEAVCSAPAHPYTAGLIAAVPAITGQAAAAGPAVRPAAVLPLATSPPSGCRFRTRCALAEDICAQQEPPLRPALGAGQLVACHFPLEPPAIASALPQTSANSG